MIQSVLVQVPTIKPIETIRFFILFKKKITKWKTKHFLFYLWVSQSATLSINEQCNELSDNLLNILTRSLRWDIFVRLHEDKMCINEISSCLQILFDFPFPRNWLEFIYKKKNLFLYEFWFHVLLLGYSFWFWESSLNAQKVLIIYRLLYGLIVFNELVMYEIWLNVFAYRN